MIAIPVIIAVYILPTVAGLASVGDWSNWGIRYEKLPFKPNSTGILYSLSINLIGEDVPHGWLSV